MGKLKKIFTNARVIILLIFLLLAIVAIHPMFGAQGVAIRSVAPNSSANIASIINPKPTSTPTSRERILTINQNHIDTVKDYFDAKIHIDFAIKKKIIKERINVRFDNVTKLEKSMDEKNNQIYNFTISIDDVKKVSNICFNSNTNDAADLSKIINNEVDIILGQLFGNE